MTLHTPSQCVDMTELNIAFTAEQLSLLNQSLLQSLPGYKAPPNVQKLLAIPGRIEQLQQYQPVTDVFLVATRLLICIGQAHAFSDANKRTALLAVLCYLATQEVQLHPLPEDFSKQVVACILGELSEPHFARLLALYRIEKA